MKVKTPEIITVVVVSLFLSLLLCLLPIAIKKTDSGKVVYDCRLAEISPDFPIEVRNACRNRNATKH